MNNELTSNQLEKQASFKAFADEHIAPFADEFDRKEQMPSELIGKMAENGYFGAVIPAENGGMGWDSITCGLLYEEIGGASASLLSLLTVHGMVSHAIIKWGTPEQKNSWLPKLASGEIIGAFGLTEPTMGSDAKSVRTEAVQSGEGFVLTGKKKWISCGQIARLFLVIAQCDGKSAAFLVEGDAPGFSREPMSGLLGFRSAMLAELHMENCRIPAENLVGRIGFGFSHVAGAALDQGRYCIAWGCVGLARACVEASLSYAGERETFGRVLGEHQLIQRMIANMITDVKAARLLCQHAGHLKDAGDPGLIMETSIAKYFASNAAFKAAKDAVQIHGANGCGSEYPVQRYLRDAKIMEIIEGSNEMQQIIIARYGSMS